MVDFSDESCDSDSDVENEDTDKAASLERSLREYQKELAENALDGQNTIIYAPAGSGKTRVATYILLKHLETQSENKPEKSVAFLARTIPLVMQQYNSLKKYLPSKYMVENITSFSKYSNCLHKLVNLYNVFVMTPSILENHVIGENPLIENGLAAFSLLIFDECHHTRKNETYYKLMLRYLHTKEKYPNKLPQIVGLTASIGVENAANDPEADKSVMRICGHLDAVSISNVKRNEEELNKEVPFPEEGGALGAQIDESLRVRGLGCGLDGE
ncbi:interferon-induced helicase c domain-containing protein 1 [Plakobranchus ocellatus]|uniref:Interferon-induced helicase c domain-containing protein 1 n=1 Tax=Plakobranchus ocellatus TaxID=259542 RepID=A0AAV4B994_9GAST|nr:interferon-induced helicase c domain-containing protein 1 [Plakobranchus ocellatus]